MGGGGARRGGCMVQEQQGKPQKKLQREKGGTAGREDRRGGGKPREAPAAESARSSEDPASAAPPQPLPCTLLQPHSPCPHYTSSARLHNECINYFSYVKGTATPPPRGDAFSCKKLTTRAVRPCAKLQQLIVRLINAQSPVQYIVRRLKAKADELMN